MMRYARPAFFLFFVCSIAGLACEETKPVEQTVAPKSTGGLGDASRKDEAGARADVDPSARKDTPRALSEEKITELCATVCEKTSAMPCVDSSKCTSGCTQTYLQPVCRPELDAMLKCSASSSIDAFECGTDGVPALKETACEAKQEVATNCIIKVMRQGTKTL